MARNLWDTSQAPSEDNPIDLAVYRSRLIGADPGLVVWGGGNTSVKTTERDHVGRERRVLRIKGSGTDLKSVDRSSFPGIFLDEILPLRDRETMTDEEMVAYLEHCLVEPRGIRPSIETLLHGFLPFKHIDHTHADAIITLTNTEHGREAVREALGEGVAIVPWRRPGFDLSKEVAELADAEAVVLENHGLITWGDTAEETYRRTIELVDRAERWLESRTREAQGSLTLQPFSHSLGQAGEGGQAQGTALSSSTTTRIAPEVSSPSDLVTLLLRLRGRLGHRVLRVWTGEEFRSLADRPDVSALANAGPATADHVLRIRPWACVLDRDDPAAAVDGYVEKYRAFFERNAWPGLEMLEPLPKVFLAPGIGMITAGRNEKDAVVTADVALHTLRIAARGTDVHGSYRSLSDRDLFDVEYWPLELYKLTLAPAPRELEGRIAVVTGAASGIGRAVAQHLSRLGAQPALIDIDSAGLETTAQQLRDESGLSPLCLVVDVTREDAVSEAIRQVIARWGGIDALVSNAGIAVGGNLIDLDPGLWRRSMEVNATSHFLLTAQVMKAMMTQGLGGSLVFIASKNAFGPGAGFGAYSVAKAGEVQLARIAALEGGPHSIRANVINPDAIFEDSKLWTEDVRRARASAHGISLDELEEFYAQRNLLKTRVTGREVAEAAAFLISDRSRATTGTVITVDGGVAAAFPR